MVLVSRDILDPGLQRDYKGDSGREGTETRLVWSKDREGVVVNCCVLESRTTNYIRM